MSVNLSFLRFGHVARKCCGDAGFRDFVFRGRQKDCKKIEKKIKNMQKKTCIDEKSVLHSEIAGVHQGKTQ